MRHPYNLHTKRDHHTKNDMSDKEEKAEYEIFGGAEAEAPEEISEETAQDGPEAEDAAAPSPEEQLAAALAEVAALRAAMKESTLRQAAEMENFKKRLAREHQEQMRYAAEKVLGDLLPTLDNLDLALQYGTKNEVCRDLMQGVALTHKLLLEAVRKHGLNPVGVVGEAFNPEIHEAIGIDNGGELEPGMVARVMQGGYKLGDRLLRPAKVMITQ